MTEDESETWLLNAGARAIERKAAQGYHSLSPLDCLIYCLWVADYGMRNAGDLATAADLHSTFLRDGELAARKLELPRAAEAFSLSPAELEDRYFDLFNGVVAEIHAADRRPL